MAINCTFNHLLKRDFEDWAAEKVYKQMMDPVAFPSVKISNLLDVLKPLSVTWSCNAWNKIKERLDLIIKGWSKSFNYLDPVEPEVHMEASQRVHKNELKAYGYEPEEEERDLTLSSRRAPRARVHSVPSCPLCLF